MISSIIGDTGRIYTGGTLLRRHPHDSNFDIFKVEFEGKNFIAKRVPKRCFEVAQRVAADLPSSRNLRIHVDQNSEESVLVYTHFRDTLLDLIKNDPAFPPQERLKVLQDVGEAVQELHAKDWVHADIKPDNVLVDWTHDSDDKKVITNVVLGDFDIARKLKEGETLHLRRAEGNAMWRSPEGQTGITNRATDIYSLALVYFYTLGAGDLFIPDPHEKGFGEAATSLEQEVITRHFCYFGPVPESLYARVKDEEWKIALQQAAQLAEKAVEDNPMLRCRVWGAHVGDAALDMLSGMTNLDPKARLTIDQVVAHPYWEEAAA